MCYTASSSVFVPSHVDVWSHGRKLKDQYHAQSLEIWPIKVLRLYGWRKLNVIMHKYAHGTLHLILKSPCSVVIDRGPYLILD